MGINVIGPRKLNQVRKAVQDWTIDRAWVNSHVRSGRIVHFVTSEHRHGYWDRLTDEVGWFADDVVVHVSSCDRFKKE